MAYRKIDPKVFEGRQFNMKLMPLTQWYCDTCGEIIQDSSQGWLEWIRSDTGPRSFRICHHYLYSPLRDDSNDREGCYAHSRAQGRSDMHLDSFLGPDGLDRLLSLLERRPCCASSLEEWSLIIRRLFIPHFEEAKEYFAQAQEDGLMSSDAYCRQDLLLAVIAKYTATEIDEDEETP